MSSKIAMWILLMCGSCNVLQASLQSRVLKKQEMNVAELAEAVIDTVETHRNMQCMSRSLQANKYAGVYESQSLRKELREFEKITAAIDTYLASEHVESADQKTLKQMRQEELAWAEE